ncbi:hypothetical protein HH310_01180 [Actinoplanes sp. TBRC 11911]|uniref:PucR family transcriptional regulator n=1 Tax=Actinoplanes sp. TBRC 11911 TaxID=2729386 RepID=UPI00145CBA5A|nr:helix-turn-helix domain-containing protein [Actinoplanes sp. TBRC 11911]NMO49813.1 hypothetical protein [Actinoplanes sp. TBRC 11911]
MNGSNLVDRVCAELLFDVDDLAADAVARIRREFPEYAVLDNAEHTVTAAYEMRKIIGAFREHRRPAPIDVRPVTARGLERAAEGIPIETMIGGYDTGFDVLWSSLRDRVVAREPAGEADLVPVVTIMLAWSRRITAAIGEGYASATARTDREENARAFVHGLAHGGAGSEAVESAARTLGFAPAGTFQVICASADGWTSQALRDLRRALPKPAAVVVLAGVLTVTVQGISVATALALLGEHTVAGVGLPRAGLAGAADSLTDAERALTLAHRRGTAVHFEKDWLLATLLPHAQRLAPLTHTDAGEDFPHLADAVRAYAGNNFSIAASAESLDLAANTVKYRLARWQEITGWDPRTLDGLMRSLISLAERDC